MDVNNNNDHDNDNDNDNNNNNNKQFLIIFSYQQAIKTILV